MKKALLVSTISGFVPQFEMNSVQILQENGYEVHYATNYNYVFYGKDNRRLDGTGIVRHQIDFARTPYSKQTYVAYRQLCQLLKENSFDMIHCHTPLGGMLARIVGQKYHVPKIVYTAHGFHFYKGAAWKNWLLYFPMEKLAARYTDALITINKEDYYNAKKFRLKKGGCVYYLPGAGVDCDKFRNVSVDIACKRKELGLNLDDFVIVSVGELNANKNHSVVIKGLKNIKHDNIKYLICGEGEKHNELLQLIDELDMKDTVKLLGYRSDIPEIEKASDLYAFPSYREGLPVSLMEAMAAGLPIVASKIRGNTDLVTSAQNGYLLSPKNVEQWSRCISYVLKNIDCLYDMKQNNLEKIKNYDKMEVQKKIEKVYKEQKII